MMMWGHFPVLGMLGAVTFILVALLLHSDELRRMSLGFLGLIGVITLVVYVVNLSDERMLAQQMGFSTLQIQAREQLQSIAIAGVVLLAIIALLALWLFPKRGRPIPRSFMIFILALSLIGGLLLARASSMNSFMHHFPGMQWMKPAFNTLNFQLDPVNKTPPAGELENKMDPLDPPAYDPYAPDKEGDAEKEEDDSE